MPRRNSLRPQSPVFVVGPRGMPGKIDALYLGHTHQPSCHPVSGHEKATIHWICTGLYWLSANPSSPDSWLAAW